MQNFMFATAVKSVKRISCAEQLFDGANGRLSIIYDEIAAVPRISTLEQRPQDSPTLMLL